MPDAEATPDDHRLAAELATEAGELLVDLRAELVAAGADAGRAQGRGRPPVPRPPHGAAGRAAPGDAVLSEEGKDEQGPAAPARRRAGVDRRPARRHPRVLRAAPGRLGRPRRPRRSAASRWPAPSPCPAQRVTLDDRPAPADAARPAGPAPGHRQPHPAARRSPRTLADALGGELVEMGSAGAKVWRVVLGAADVYAHGGGQYEWDSAAPVAVAARRRPARLPARRLAARLQQPRPVPARPARLPPRRWPTPVAGASRATAAGLTARRTVAVEPLGSHPGDDDGAVVARGPGLERVDRGPDAVGDLGGRRVGRRRAGHVDQAGLAEELAARAAGLGDAVGVEHERLAGCELDRRPRAGPGRAARRAACRPRRPARPCRRGRTTIGRG